MNLYKNIHDENIKNYGLKYKNTTNIVINQYNDRTHFIFELLQNAEDAGAEVVSFELRNDCLIIEHDGNEFNDDDIRSICAIGESTKAEEKSGIGKFGIGFKSVYSYTKTPCIYSGEYSFQINDCIFPEEIPSIQLADGHTVFKLQFDHDEVDKETAYKEISNALQTQLDEASVLMLNNIQKITVKTAAFSSQIVSERKHISDDRKVIEVKTEYYFNNNKNREQRYIQFTDNEKYSSVLMFKVDGDRIVKTDKKNNYIYSYFPTSVESHQHFLIQAPFNTTPARDNIKLNDAANKRFVKSICELLKYSFIWFRDQKKITVQSLSDVYPIHPYNELSLFYPIYKTAVTLINTENLLPVEGSDEYVSISNGYIADTAKIVDLIDNSILKLLEGYKSFWVEKSIINTENHGFYRFITDNTDIKSRRKKLVHLVDKMNNGFYENRNSHNSVKWFSELFQMIENNPSDFKGKVKTYPFIRLSTGKHIAPYDEKNNLLVYLNNPAHCEYKINSDFLANSTIKEFYSHVLGIEEYNKVHFVLDKILPKYSTPFNETNIKENCSDLAQVVSALKDGDDGRIKKQLYNSYIIKSSKKWYRPDSLNIPLEHSRRPAFMKLFEEYLDVLYVDSSYFEVQDSIKVEDFILIGCRDDVKYNIAEPSAYISFAKNYGVESLYYGNIAQKNLKYIDGLEQVLKRSDEISSMYIAYYFNEKLSNDDFELTFYSKNCRYENFMGVLLNYIPWMFTSDNVKVAPASIRRTDLADKYYKYDKLLDSLSFQDENTELKKLVSECTSGPIKDIILRMLDNPEDVKAAEKFFDKKDKKEAKHNTVNNSGVNPLDMLNNMTKVQFGNGEGWDEMPVESVANQSKRKTKLQKEFEESIGKKTSVLDSSSIRFSFITSSKNKDEKTFLKMNYQGRCQICDGTIVDYKNENYFEAINIINTQNAPVYMSDSISGWNSLSLCPNCAAKLKVCSKDLTDFARQVLNYRYENDDDEKIPVSIILKGEKIDINYTPKHFIALQQALEFFKNNKDI